MSCCCIPLQFALMLVLTFAPCAGGVFLPSTGANTPLAHVVVSTCCSLRWWCFSFQQLAQILHLHMWWSSAVATCAGGVFSSNHWRKYSTCTRATCTVWWWYIYIYIYGWITVCIYMLMCTHPAPPHTHTVPLIVLRVTEFAYTIHRVLYNPLNCLDMNFY